MCRSGENPRILLGQKCANVFENKISCSLTTVLYRLFRFLQYRILPTCFFFLVARIRYRYHCGYGLFFCLRVWILNIFRDPKILDMTLLTIKIVRYLPFPSVNSNFSFLYRSSGSSPPVSKSNELLKGLLTARDQQQDGSRGGGAQRNNSSQVPVIHLK